MKITIVCVGRIKEKFYRDAIAEYEKRLSKYCKFEIIEVADEKGERAFTRAYFPGKDFPKAFCGGE